MCKKKCFQIKISSTPLCENLVNVTTWNLVIRVKGDFLFEEVGTFLLWATLLYPSLLWLIFLYSAYLIYLFYKTGMSQIS